MGPLRVNRCCIFKQDGGSDRGVRRFNSVVNLDMLEYIPRVGDCAASKVSLWRLIIVQSISSGCMGAVTALGASSRSSLDGGQGKRLHACTISSRCTSVEKWLVPLS
jgi:hypothetical protein